MPFKDTCWNAGAGSPAASEVVGYWPPARIVVGILEPSAEIQVYVLDHLLSHQRSIKSYGYLAGFRL